MEGIRIILKKTRNNLENSPYIEDSVQEYSGVLVRYQKIYYQNYETYFSGFNTLAEFNKKSNDKSLYFLEIVKPDDGDYVKNAQKIIDAIPVDEIGYVHVKYLVIGLTITITVAKSIFLAVGDNKNKIKNFFNELYQDVKRRFPKLKIISAYANPSKCMLVITGIPFRERTGSRKNLKGYPNIYISYSKVVKDVPKITLAKELFKELEKKPFYKNVLKEKARVGTPSWCQEKILTAYKNHDLSYSALGLYVNLIFEKDIIKYNREQMLTRKRSYDKSRKELIERGYVILINTNSSNSNFSKDKKNWELRIL